jgi:hypothetical protein
VHNIIISLKIYKQDSSIFNFLSLIMMTVLVCTAYVKMTKAKAKGTKGLGIYPQYLLSFLNFFSSFLSFPS